ncbi:MAG: site-2 protease family protein [Candidatus Cloacimonadota bacterium]|nr:MAG: site-2 protease family protein [Candidatus Cloacimonadota bacterium]
MLFIILNIVILLLSIIIHEISHGFAALKFGDPTARMRGRLTLNPIPHIDIVGTIVLPIMLILVRSPVLFGWAKPVPVNPFNFKNPRRDMMLTSLAGPLSNFALAIIFSLLYRIFLLFGGKGSIPIQVFEYGAAINILLFCFNLFPIPPLDGSKILMYFLPDNIADGFRKIEPFGFIIIFGLFFLGILGGILYPIMTFFLYILLGAGI